MDNFLIKTKRNEIVDAIFDNEKVSLHISNIDDDNDKDNLKIGYNSSAFNMFNKYGDIPVVNKTSIMTTVSIDGIIFAVKYNGKIVPITDIYHEDSKSFELDGTMKYVYEKFADKKYYVTRDHLVEVAEAAIEFENNKEQKMSLK